jgi:hypothetical protein
MSLVLLFHYLLLNMFRMLVHPYSGACDLFVELFHGLYWSGTMCVGVTLWFGWGGVVPLRRLKHCFSLHKDTTPPQPHQISNTQRTKNETTNVVIHQHSRKLLMMDILMSETCWACNTDTTQTQPHQISNTQRTKNIMTSVVIHQHSGKLLMMTILMSERCWVHKKWNKIASDIKFDFYSTAIWRLRFIAVCHIIWIDITRILFSGIRDSM